MRKHLLLLGLAFICAAAVAVATQQQFMFGVWNGLEGATDFSQRCTMLYDTLRMNTVLDICVNDYQLAQYSDTTRPLKVIVSNHDYGMNGGMNGYLRLYTLAPYAFFESEGTEFAASHLRYIGGRDTTIGEANCRYFQAMVNPPDSLMLIQTGPGSDSGGYRYNQTGWYPPQFMNTQHEPAHLQYKAFLRFKLGPRIGSVSSEPIAVFYIGRDSAADQILSPEEHDSLLDRHEPIYLYDSQFDSAGTEFVWTDSMVYSWINPIDNPYRDGHPAVNDVMFNVRWSGRRDIYIDKVKVMDKYGYDLWEDTVVSYPKIDSFVTRFYDTSATVLGWYLQDDQDPATNCNNVYSARRVDSLLTHRFSHKPGFVVPGAQTGYLSIASYSNVSFWFYPTRRYTPTFTTDESWYALQGSWKAECADLANMRGLADSKGVPLYTTLQSIVDDSTWRPPTPQENLCQVNLALAYGTEGIMYFRYGGDGCWEDDTGRTDFWYSVKDVVGPYMDKMGPIFASLEWMGASKWSQGNPFYGIDSITCNEYAGDDFYLQVAAFENDSDDAEYYMLVNRRCLPSEIISGRVVLQGIPLKAVLASPPDPLCPPPPCATGVWVTNMETGFIQYCPTPIENCVCGRPSFAYAIAPGAARLFRVSWEAPPGACRHGDADGSGSINISDAVFLIAYVFSHGPAPDPMAAGDADSNGTVNISDAVFLIAYIFAHGSAPSLGCE